MYKPGTKIYSYEKWKIARYVEATKRQKIADYTSNSLELEP